MDRFIVFLILISSAFSNISLIFIYYIILIIYVTIGLAVGIVICFLQYIYLTSDSQFLSQVENYHINDIYKPPRGSSNSLIDGILVFHLNGFLFFGSCIRVCNRIEGYILNNKNTLRYISF